MLVARMGGESGPVAGGHDRPRRSPGLARSRRRPGTSRPPSRQPAARAFRGPHQARADALIEQEPGDRHVERVGQGGKGLERRRRLVVLDLAEIADVQARCAPRPGQGQAALEPAAPDLGPDGAVAVGRTASVMQRLCRHKTGIDKNNIARQDMAHHQTPLGTGQSHRISRRNGSTMKVAIIGAGNVGKALGTSITRAGHEVTISAKNPEHARAAAREIGAKPRRQRAPPWRMPDVVILAVPFGGRRRGRRRDQRRRVAGKTIVDVTNPIRPDFSGLATEAARQRRSSSSGSRCSTSSRPSTRSSRRTRPTPTRGDRRLRRRRRREGQARGDPPSSTRWASPPLDVGPLSSRPLPRGDGLHEHRPQRCRMAGAGPRPGSSER